MNFVLRDFKVVQKVHYHHHHRTACSTCPSWCQCILYGIDSNEDHNCRYSMPFIHSYCVLRAFEMYTEIDIVIKRITRLTPIVASQWWRNLALAQESLSVYIEYAKENLFLRKVSPPDLCQNYPQTAILAKIGL